MNHLLRFVSIAICLSLLAGNILAKGNDDEKWGKVTEDQWNLAAPDSLPDAPAIILFDIGVLEVPAPYPNNRIEYSRNVRIKVLNKEGATQAAMVEIVLYKDDLLKGFKASTLLRNGKKIEVGDKEVFRKDVNGVRLVTFTFPAIEDGCILEYKYMISHRRYNFLDPWYFQSALFTLKSRFSLILHAGLTYNALLSNVPEESRKPTREDVTLDDNGPVQFTWAMRDLFPIESEPFMAAANSYRAAVHCQLSSYRDAYNNISFIEDWKTLGGEILQRYESFTDSRGELMKTAKSLTADQLMPIDKIRKLYQFVRDNILTQGEGTTYGFTDGNVGRVLEQKTGNAGEKNALLIEMLRAVDLDASPVLIGRRGHAVFDPRIYQMRQFDHLICMVNADDQTYFLDTRDRSVPFPYLPSDDVVAGGLLLKKSASEPITISIGNRRSIYETHSQLRIHGDGSATCSTHVTMQGYPISENRDLLKDQPTDEELRKLLFNNLSVTFEVSTYEYSREIDTDSATVDIVLRFPSLCGHTGRQIVCVPSLFWWSKNPFTKPRRSFPVDFNYPVTVSDVMDLECDEGLALAAVPQDVSEMIDGISFARSVLQADHNARIMSQIIIGKSVFPPALYGKVRSLFTKMGDAAAEPVTITY